MCKTYEQIAMAVVREDWELRKEENNPGFSQERIAQLMGISRSQLAKALTMDKNDDIWELSNEVDYYSGSNYIIDNIDAFPGEESITLSSGDIINIGEGL